MKLLDSNAWLGHYPFRAVPDNTPDGLLRLMDRHGIDQAAVSSLHCVFYVDTHSGNEELSRWIRPHLDRLIPCATLSPTYHGWEQDLRECCEKWCMRGIRLFPSHHRYSLTSPQCRELVHAAAQQGLHVAIPQRLEDRRQRHWMDVTTEISLNDIADLAVACPEANLVVLESSGIESSRFLWDPILADARVMFELSRMATVLQRTIPLLLDRLGPRHLLFGTGMPLKIPGPAVLKLQLLEAPVADKQQIAAGNMQALLGVEAASTQQNPHERNLIDATTFACQTV